jgi:hypothetical protein
VCVRVCAQVCYESQVGCGCVTVLHGVCVVGCEHRDVPRAPGAWCCCVRLLSCLSGAPGCVVKVEVCCVTPLHSGCDVVGSPAQAGACVCAPQASRHKQRVRAVWRQGLWAQHGVTGHHSRALVCPPCVLTDSTATHDTGVLRHHALVLATSALLPCAQTPRTRAHNGTVTAHVCVQRARRSTRSRCSVM